MASEAASGTSVRSTARTLRDAREEAKRCSNPLVVDRCGESACVGGRSTSTAVAGISIEIVAPSEVDDAMRKCTSGRGDCTDAACKLTTSRPLPYLVGRCVGRRRRLLDHTMRTAPRLCGMSAGSNPALFGGHLKKGFLRIQSLYSGSPAGAWVRFYEKD